MRHEDEELGEEVKVTRSRRAGMVLSVRLTPEEVEQVLHLTEARGITLSQLAREALTDYLRRGGTGGASGSPPTVTTTGLATLQVHWNGPRTGNETRGNAQPLEGSVSSDH